MNEAKAQVNVRVGQKLAERFKRETEAVRQGLVMQAALEMLFSLPKEKRVAVYMEVAANKKIQASVI